MDTLPTEIVEQILSNKTLSLEDISNIKLTCHRFKQVVQTSNYIWRNVFLKHLPQYEKFYDRNKTDWYEEFQYVYDLRKRVRGILQQMSPKYYSVADMSINDFKDWSDLLEERERTYEYIVDYLMKIVNDKNPISSIEVVPLITAGNKTLRYYGLKALQHLRHLKTTRDYKAFVSLPENKRVLEKGAVIIAQWCQYEIEVDYESVCKSLDYLTIQAREELRVSNPNHPLFNVGDEQLQKWRDENLSENQFNGPQCMQIIEALTMTFFKKHKFCGNVSDFYMPQNSYINIVLDKKYGLPITLSIVYESIARRMGVNCEPMNIPAHFLLRFQADSHSRNVLFIDAFNEGQLFPRGICQYSHASPDKIPRATAHKVLKRMAANLEESLRVNTHTKADLTQLRSILELMVMIAPYDLNCIVNLSRLCMSLNMDTHYIEEIIQSTEYEEPQNAENVLQMLRDYEIHRQHEHLFEQCQPKKRTTTIQYAVGMVMRHKILNYKGVITDWTPICKATHAWQKSMNVDKLKYKGNQPFYNVIVEDGTQRYVAEENIEIVSDTGFLYLNDEIGRHFSHFFVNHYVPNLEKEKEYPEDTAIRQSFYQQMLWCK